jgi:tRNA1Val (adenine37-N6)-methyltransferase
MKVTSDACLFGAWFNLENATRILDIGTGTGLLALMAAQRFTAEIDALEIDQEAAQQACTNVGLSPWKHRITIHPVSLQHYVTDQTLLNSYDHVVCNPPFHDQATESQSPKKRIAWHAGQLNLADLIAAAAGLLKPSGSLHLILPYQNKDRLATISQAAGFYTAHLCSVRSFVDRLPRRFMTTLKLKPCAFNQTELVVYQQHQVYTPQCRALLLPFLIRI